MLREARVLGALQGRARVPRVLGVCADDDVLGVPFYVMQELHGDVVTDALPPALATADCPPQRGQRPRRRARRAARRRRRERRPDRLRAPRWLPRAAGTALRGAVGGQRHARPPARERAGRLARRSHPVLGCHLRRARRLPARQRDARARAAARAGAARLGARDARRSARRPRLPRRHVLGRRLARHRAGAVARDAQRRLPEPWRARRALRRAQRAAVDALAWYETLALWKAAVFCEGIYGRVLRGETADAWERGLEEGVPGLLRAAAATAERA